MSNYTINVDWDGKDALADSNAAKVISGDDFQTEFETVQTAVNSKAELNGSSSESFSIDDLTVGGDATIAGTLDITGDATAPTQSSSDNSTKIATTAYVATAVAALDSAAINNVVYPVGSIYTATVSTNPNSLLGVGTWTAFGAGKVLVGLDASDTDFDVVEETGGSKTHTLTTSEMPAHTHTAGVGSDSAGNGAQSRSPVGQGITTSSTGGGGAHNNLQPYIVVYMWKRTA